MYVNPIELLVCFRDATEKGMSNRESQRFGYFEGT